ncbi:hypothetical protein [Nonomuraea basaltis]|uniref:hypothetical protein n=1 Tax=Nonomuraea basaltis TaxID=2495887 RepID=UPI00110C48AB|nr:hypothetical protein [Nonomuraea basaltis]
MKRQRMVWLLLVTLGFGVAAVHILRCHGPSGHPAAQSASWVTLSGYETTSGGPSDVVSCAMAADPPLLGLAAPTSVVKLPPALTLPAGLRSDAGEGRVAMLSWRGRGPPSSPAPDLAVLSVLRI